MSNDRQSFFEFLSIANQERIHSQIISWFFSDNFKEVQNIDKINLIKKLFNIECSHIEYVITEYKNIDIIIKTDSCVIILENKLKSSQYLGQLNKYREIAEKDFQNIDKKYFYLTLINEPPSEINWQNVTYEDLLSVFQEIKLTKEIDAIIFCEYLSFLEHLINIFKDFSQNYQKYSTVFLNGSKKKIDKITYEYPTEEEKFIGINQLETIFQKNILIKIRNSIDESIHCVINETRGVALIDIILGEINVQKKKFNVFLQLQADNIKFAIASVNYDKSKKKEIECFIPFVSKIKENSNYNKLNMPKQKGYVSLSKKMPTPYWEMEYDDLIYFIKSEINEGRKYFSDLEKIEFKI
ncbi:PD-(D/E)XK nuclease family protein [Weeksellaceae bacterium TAE3-ERU29]|nr:PD-(D/E)XK nuclease family protein [Weeksellaceae bacterium TAE3-ERU29]